MISVFAPVFGLSTNAEPSTLNPNAAAWFGICFEAFYGWSFGSFVPCVVVRGVVACKP